MPGCALTQDYVLDCRDGVGGSKEWYIIELENVKTLTIAAGVVTALTKQTAKKFFKYKQVKQTSEGQEDITPSEENGTSFVKQTAKMVFNKRSVQTRNEIMLLAKNRLVIVEVDNNGNAWMYGATNGMLLAPSTGKSGRAFGDRNGYELTFEGYEPELAYSVDATVVAALTTPGT